ncbi:MAG TPA: DUF4012 domain-containing protein [Patescibacteria group bacterium]|nr:DUF4012 domain-containing protein [Patescibacteria group bacterium]
MDNFLNTEVRKAEMKGKKRSIKKIILIIAVILIVLAGSGFFFIYTPVSNMKTHGMAAFSTSKKVLAAFKGNDIDLMQSELSVLKKEYEGFQKNAERLYWLRFIPFAGVYISDMRSGVMAGENMIEAGDTAVKAIAPYADLIGFKQGAPGFFEKSADERIHTAVLTLDKMLVKADDIAVRLETAQENLSRIDEKRYPKTVKGRAIRVKIKEVKEEFETMVSLFVDAKPFLKNFPEILGVKQEKTYLILFQNDKELRPTGGFLTAYAIFKVKDGKFQIVKSEDIYSLDQSIPAHPKAPREILTYHKNVPTFNIRDSNLSPDFVKSLTIFNSLYDKSRQKVDYDGVITVDTHVLVDTLAVLGDTEADGITFSSQIDKRCNCPQVVYRLFDIVDRPVGYIKENRKGILGDLLYVLVQKALSSSPSQYWGKISQDLIRNLSEKHILVYLEDQEAQQSIEKINFAGRIRDYKGDYLHINDTNFAGAKSNLFVSHAITSNTEIKDGAAIRKVTVEYKNPYPHSNCDLESGGLCLNATLRNWVRVYVPKGSRLIDFKGSETEVQTYDDLSKTVFEGFLQIKPKGKATIIVTYELPFKVEKEYALLIQKQPGTDEHAYTIMVNGKTQERFGLITDKELKLKL